MVFPHGRDFNISCFLFWTRTFLNASGNGSKCSQFKNWLKFLFLDFSMPLSYKSLTSIFKSSRISGHLSLWDSKDPLVFLVSINLKSGPYKATSAAQITEAGLNFHKIRGRSWECSANVKSGTKSFKTNNVSKGIIHLASDWILLANDKGNYLFPVQLAFTELCPDIALFSKLSLTCVSREIMESWHSQELNKYTPLAKVDDWGQ